MKTSGFASFDEFWPYYLSEHRDPRNRWLHFCGTHLFLATLVAGALVDPRWFFASPVAGYGPAWFGHFVIEKNRPATFRHPIWSLMGDFRMVWMMWRGRLRKPAGA
jgi:hypothetical protein